MPVSAGAGQSNVCSNRQLCQNCGTMTHTKCLDDVISPSTAEECLVKAGSAALAGFDPYGTCRTYINANCMGVYSVRPMSRSVYGGWAARPTCTTGM